MGVHATLRVQDQIGVVTLNSPGMANVINKEVVKDIEDVLYQIEQTSEIKGSVLISNKPNCFIAGADINLLSTIHTAEEGKELSKFTQGLLKRVETSKKPFVAAIMGSCLGGGLEVALACHYRLAVRGNSTFGFPEVLLGLLPGAGGTQRLPQLTALPDALDIMLTGKNIQSEKAKSLGFVDHLVDSVGPGMQQADQRTLEYLRDIAIKVCLDLARGDLKVNRNPQNISNIIFTKFINTKFARNYIFTQARKKVLKQTRGLYPAPLKILYVTKKGLENGHEAGYDEEATSFGKLAISKESKGLISLFYGQNECKKNRLRTKNNTDTIAVLGAGLMGAGIADVSIQNGYKTILKDVTLERIMRGEDHIEKAINLSQKKKRISQIEGDRYLSRLITTTNYDKFTQADIVIESVFEDLDLKQRVMKEVENNVLDHCIYATNTSALLVSEIAEASKRPDKVIGMHYFSPANKMQLLEIVITKATSEDTLGVALDVGLRQGKVPIIVKDGPGFYTTRIIMPMITEGFRLMLEGANPERLDQLSMDLGFPVGLVTLSDEVGIDVGYHVYKYFVNIFGDRMKVVDMNLGAAITNAGFLGRKSGKGAYIYQRGSKEKIVNQEALYIMQKFKVEPKLPLTNENIQHRILSRFVNEAVMCLQEGIISNPMEGDIGAVFGLGFPPFTGGPFHYIDSFGADKFVSLMQKLENAYGPSFTPCQMLVEYAKDTSKKFFKH